MTEICGTEGLDKDSFLDYAYGNTLIETCLVRTDKKEEKQSVTLDVFEQIYFKSEKNARHKRVKEIMDWYDDNNLEFHNILNEEQFILRKLQLGF